MAKRFAVLVAAVVCLALPATNASAQGLFDALFGGAAPRSAPAYPPQAMSYADPTVSPGGQAQGSASHGSGRAVAFCVRLCDGRHFPMQRHRNATPAQLCSAMCPAAKTMVFNGNAIDTAAGPKGERYANLENAFVYRKQIVSDCSCNGKDAFGLAPIDAANDPTLQAGDVVATSTGLVAYTGRREANFTPIQNYPALGNELRQKLSTLNVTPVN
jgi:hypothetical protein